MNLPTVTTVHPDDRKGGGFILIKKRKGTLITKADKCVCLSDTSLPLLM